MGMNLIIVNLDLASLSELMHRLHRTLLGFHALPSVKDRRSVIMSMIFSVVMSMDILDSLLSVNRMRGMSFPRRGVTLQLSAIVVILTMIMMVILSMGVAGGTRYAVWSLTSDNASTSLLRMEARLRIEARGPRDRFARSCPDVLG